VRLLEESIGTKAIIEFMPLQIGDVTATEADISDLNHDVGFTPSTTVAVGIPRFVSWFRQYHRL